MIFTNRTITVRKGESRIDEPIVVYRGDYELEVRFTILNSRFKFMSGTNMIESEKASYGQLAILTPYGGNIFSDIVRCNDGSVTFVLTAEMLNQIEEVGLYSFQIRLMDYNKESRVSIPPIEFGIEVREPIASEDHDNSVNNAIVGYSIAKVVDPKEENVGDTFDESGNYNKTKWETGDRISEGKLNKIEDAIDKVNRNEKNDVAALDKRVSSIYSTLNSELYMETNELSNRLDNIIANNNHSDGNSELVDIRVSNSGTIYDSAGEAVRAISEGKEIQQKVFSSCFREKSPSYTIADTGTVVNLKDIIVDIEIEGADEDVLVSVGRVVKDYNGLNLIALYKCFENGKPDGSENGLVFVIDENTNKERFYQTSGVLNGVKVVGRIVVKNWSNVPAHDQRNIHYNISGVSNKCFIKTRFDLVSKNEVDENISEIRNSVQSLKDDKLKFMNSDILEQLFTDIQIIGMNDERIAVGTVRKGYTNNGTQNPKSFIGVYGLNERDEADPDKLIFQINFSDDEANQNNVRKIVKSTFNGKDVELRATIDWGSIKNDYILYDIGHYSIGGIRKSRYISDYSDLLYNEYSREIKDKTLLLKNEVDENISEIRNSIQSLNDDKLKFMNSDILEQLFTDIQIIGMNDERIAVGTVRKGYTNNGTQNPKSFIGVYGLDDRDRADANKLIFYINFSDDEANQNNVRKIVKSTFNGKDVELRATIDWGSIENDYILHDIGHYSIGGIRKSRYISDYSDLLYHEYSREIREIKDKTLLLMNETNEIPVITFVDDDGTDKFLTKSKPIYDKYGVKCTVAVITNFVQNGNGMDVDELLTIANEGYDIVSHTHTHAQPIYKPGYVTANLSEIEEDIRLSYEYLKNNGLETDTIVWAWGYFEDPLVYTKIAKKYFKYGVNAGGGVMTAEVLNDMYYDRYFINMNKSIDTYKDLIDECYTNNGWLIFGTHSGNDDEIDSNFLDAILEYIKSKNIQIMTLKDANKIKGNICSIGNYGERGNSLYIGRNGIVLN